VLLPLEPLIDVALDPVVDVPEEPTTGALGAAGALLAAVLPVEVLGGLPPPNGAILGTAVGSDGRMPSRRPPASPGGSLLARHCLMNLLFCWPIRSISIASRSHRSFFVASALFPSAAKAVSPDKLKAAPAIKSADAKTIAFVMMELRRAHQMSSSQQTSPLSGFQIFLGRNSPCRGWPATFVTDGALWVI
jgi:hypothetical protein